MTTRDFEHCSICTNRIHSINTRSYGGCFWCENCYNRFVSPLLSSVAADLSNKLYLFVRGMQAAEEPKDTVFQFQFWRSISVSPMDIPPQGGNAETTR